MNHPRLSLLALTSLALACATPKERVAENTRVRAEVALQASEASLADQIPLLLPERIPDPKNELLLDHPDFVKFKEDYARWARGLKAAREVLARQEYEIKQITKRLQGNLPPQERADLEARLAYLKDQEMADQEKWVLKILGWMIPGIKTARVELRKIGIDLDGLFTDQPISLNEWLRALDEARETFALSR